MSVALVLLLVAAVAVLAAYLRSTETLRPRRAPKPGEGLPRPAGLDPFGGEPVVVRVLAAPEAELVRGLLESNGIPVGLRSTGLSPVHQPARRLEVLVPADRVAEAEALLGT
jgi:hypothetical protein